MAVPDYDGKGDATPGEWKALLAPMLSIAGSAEDLRCYVVVAVAVSTDDQVELRTNLPDVPLGAILRMVTPEAKHA